MENYFEYNVHCKWGFLLIHFNGYDVLSCFENCTFNLVMIEDSQKTLYTGLGHLSVVYRDNKNTHLTTPTLIGYDSFTQNLFKS